MNTLARFVFIVCISMSVGTEEVPTTELLETDIDVTTQLTYEVNASELVEKEKLKSVPPAIHVARSIDKGYDNDFTSSAEQHAAFRKRAKPLKNIFMGIYKNYKSTYLGNRTTEQYKQNLRERLGVSPEINEEVQSQETESPNEVDVPDAEEQDEDGTQASVEETLLPISAVNALEWMAEKLSESTATLLNKKRRKRKRQHQYQEQQEEKKRAKIAAPAGGDDPLLSIDENAYRYNVGPGVNMSLDMMNDVIRVNLDGNNLREIMSAHWLGDNSEQGRGKKYDMMTKVLPLFILPFLIQSAIVPFLVTKLKLLLMKSILVGKLAIFLIIISAIKNSNKMIQSYEVAPSYWAGEPSRRSELAAAASSSAYNGYRVEGKPTTWIN